jgi:colanic acid/amylovoran biosynthesis glycosyltransferase
MPEASSPVLAVVTPRLGAASETFIRRHITEVAPGQTVVVARDTKEDWTLDVPVLHLNRYPNLLGKPARRLGLPWLDVRSCRMAAFLRQQEASAVLMEWLNFAAEWIPAVRGLGTRCFAHAHGYDVTSKTLRRPGTRRLYRRLREMEGIITVSEVTRQRLIDLVGLDPSRLHVIPCGVDIPVPCPRHETSDRVACLAVGRLVQKKGPLDALRAFHRAYRRFPRLTLEWIGDGPLRKEAEAFIREHRLEGVVVFQGRRPHAFILERLRQADLFLLPSCTSPSGDEEGLPVSILEAMAHGLPVLSTRHAGIPEAVLDGLTGTLVEERDWKTLGEALLRLAADGDRRHQMGQEGYTRAAACFSAAEEIRRLRALIFKG